MGAASSEPEWAPHPDQKKVLILGGGGLLGRPLIEELVRRNFAVMNVSSRPWSQMHTKFQRLCVKSGVHCEHIDLDADVRHNAACRLRELLVSRSFDLVVNLVADRGGVKYDGKMMKMNHPVLNTELPKHLVDFATQQEICVPVFLISTEYVWSGIDNEQEGYPAVEIGEDNRFVGDTGAAPYATQKRAAEMHAKAKKAKLHGGDSVTIIRLPVLYGPMLNALEDGTAASSISNYLLDNTWKHDTWQKRYPTSSEDAASVIGALISKRLGPGLDKPVYNYGAQESVSKYEFMQMFCEAAGTPEELLKWESAEERPEGKRPPFNVKLDISETRKELEAYGGWKQPRELDRTIVESVWLPHFKTNLGTFLKNHRKPEADTADVFGLQRVLRCCFCANQERFPHCLQPRVARQHHVRGY